MHTAPKIAALYVQTNGPYFGLADVDPWDARRDARRYPGPLPVVAHPPCQRWAAWTARGGPGSRRHFTIGDDGGCFTAALDAVRRYGGVLEHPAHSLAWHAHGLLPPARGAGWQPAGDFLGWTCEVDQGWYGHVIPKPTWLYAVATQLPTLNWHRAPYDPIIKAKLDTYLAARRSLGYRSGIGGALRFLSHHQRSRTPLPFRDLLLQMARSHGA